MQPFLSIIILLVGVPIVLAFVWLMDRRAPLVLAVPVGETSSQDDSALIGAGVALAIINQDACDANDAASSCSADPSS